MLVIKSKTKLKGAKINIGQTRFKKELRQTKPKNVKKQLIICFLNFMAKALRTKKKIQLRFNNQLF